MTNFKYDNIISKVIEKFNLLNKIFYDEIENLNMIVKLKKIDY
jgi:hypothetical protein